MFAAEHTGVVPDILLVAKGIASGMPLGAMMAPREIMTWPPGSHGSTIAGNPVAIAAGLATINLLEGEPGREFGAGRRAAQEDADRRAGRATSGSPRCAGSGS